MWVDRFCLKPAQSTERHEVASYAGRAASGEYERALSGSSTPLLCTDGHNDSMNDDASRELAVFTEAIKVLLQDRASFLDNACGGDENLRRKVEALLRAHDRIGNFLEDPATGVSIE